MKKVVILEVTPSRHYGRMHAALDNIIDDLCWNERHKMTCWDFGDIIDVTWQYIKAFRRKDIGIFKQEAIEIIENDFQNAITASLPKQSGSAIGEETKLYDDLGIASSNYIRETYRILSMIDSVGDINKLQRIIHRNDDLILEFSGRDGNENLPNERFS